MPEDIVPTIEGQILGLLSSVIDDFIPERKTKHGMQLAQGLSGRVSPTNVQACGYDC
jgi:hypothetical protein